MPTADYFKDDIETVGRIPAVPAILTEPPAYHGAARTDGPRESEAIQR